MRARDEDKVRLVKKRAIESIVKDGLEGFSMNKLAKICGISVATLYIYYKDRDDLIISIAREEGDRMGNSFIQDFNPKLSFEDGMKIQWINRFGYIKDNPMSYLFFEQLRNSTYKDRLLENFMVRFRELINEFMQNIVDKKEINPMPLEVFWSVAYAPLYALVRFDMEGQSVGGKPFKMTDEVLWQTFDLVIKALKN
jgi:TetR/AcrR family transcriptional repressor of multidrug resistance operon